MTDTATAYHQATGYWNRTCSCGRSFKSGRGTYQHLNAERRKRARAQICVTCGERVDRHVGRWTPQDAQERRFCREDNLSRCRPEPGR